MQIKRRVGTLVQYVWATLMEKKGLSFCREATENSVERMLIGKEVV